MVPGISCVLVGYKALAPWYIRGLPVRHQHKMPRHKGDNVPCQTLIYCSACIKQLILIPPVTLLSILLLFILAPTVEGGHWVCFVRGAPGGTEWSKHGGMDGEGQLYTGRFTYTASHGPSTLLVPGISAQYTVSAEIS